MIVFVYLIGKRFFGTRSAGIASVLVAYNSLLIISSRWAMLEQEIIFYMLGACYFWFHQKRELAWISGLFLGAALLTKIISGILIPVLLIYQLFLQDSDLSQLPALWRRITKTQWLGLLIAFLLTLAGYSLIARENPQVFLNFWITHSVNRELQEYGIFYFLRVFALHFPDLLIFAGAGIVLGMQRFRGKILFLILWILATFMAVSLQSFRPDRYYYPIIPILALLAAVSLDQLFSRFDRLKLWRGALYLVITVSCLFQLGRLWPYYRETQRFNPPLIAAAEWLDSHLQPGEYAVSMCRKNFAWYFMHLMNHRLINASLSNDSRSAQDAPLSLPPTRFLLLYVPSHQPLPAGWNELLKGFVEVRKFGSIIIMEAKKPNGPETLIESIN